MNGFRKIFPIFLSHYATFFAKRAERKVVPFDELPVKINVLISETPCIRKSVVVLSLLTFYSVFCHVCQLMLCYKQC
jgi:hypothetical protein